MNQLNERSLAGRHPLYDLWRGMVRRCYDKNATGYHRYGGRGIVVCDGWRANFWRFANDVTNNIGPRPSPRHTIDRYPDNDGNYELGNIRWATEAEQNRNRRDNRHLTANDKTQTLAEWAIETGLPITTIFNRLVRGWSDHDAVMIASHAKAPDHSVFPPGGYRICLELGINPETVKSRLRRGWNFDAALTTPIDHRRNRHATTQRTHSRNPNPTADETPADI